MICLHYVIKLSFLIHFSQSPLIYIHTGKYLSQLFSSIVPMYCSITYKIWYTEAAEFYKKKLSKWTIRLTKLLNKRKNIFLKNYFKKLNCFEGFFSKTTFRNCRCFYCAFLFMARLRDC